MSKTTGLDRAVEYVEKITAFKTAFQAQDQRCINDPNTTVEIETGRKFDRVITNTGGQRTARYFVDRHSWDIFGAKSFAQVNTRRWYGTLDSIAEYDWSSYYGVPIAGTAAETAHNERETEIVSQHRPRGRPRKES